MEQYRLKSTEKGTIEMLNGRGESVPLTFLLSSYPQGRIFAFYAPMGAGKTTFIRSLCQEMGIEDEVNSPTFAIVNVYDIPCTYAATLPGIKELPDKVNHFDCYRLKSAREALDIGAEEYLYSGQYCFIEWPENIESLLPEETIIVRISVVSETERILSVEYPGQ